MVNGYPGEPGYAPRHDKAIHGFWVGTGIFIAIAVVLSIFMFFYAGIVSKDRTQVSSNRP